MKLELNELELGLLSAVLFDDIKLNGAGEGIFNDLQKTKLDLLKRIQMMDKDATPQEIEEFIQSIADEVGLSAERIDN